MFEQLLLSINELFLNDFKKQLDQCNDLLENEGARTFKLVYTVRTSIVEGIMSNSNSNTDCGM